eukprot:4329012-Prymnesium_polylepis.2
MILRSPGGQPFRADASQPASLSVVARSVELEPVATFPPSSFAAPTQSPVPSSVPRAGESPMKLRTVAAIRTASAGPRLSRHSPDRAMVASLICCATSTPTVVGTPKSSSLRPFSSSDDLSRAARGVAPCTPKVDRVSLRAFAEDGAHDLAANDARVQKPGVVQDARNAPVPQHRQRVAAQGSLCEVALLEREVRKLEGRLCALVGGQLQDFD